MSVELQAETAATFVYSLRKLKMRNPLKHWYYAVKETFYDLLITAVVT
jgi:hypothetical protein